MARSAEKAVAGAVTGRLAGVCNCVRPISDSATMTRIITARLTHVASRICVTAGRAVDEWA